MPCSVPQTRVICPWILRGLFVELGEVARDNETGVLITIDELHYVSLHTLEALVMGLHRASQLGLPITISGAGLPTLATLTGEAKSYAERMFNYPVIDSLAGDQPREALVVPASDEGVTWADDAVALVVEVSKGYPYFLQEFKKHAWDLAGGPVITLDDVERSIPLATAQLDDGFFRVRIRGGRTTPSGLTFERWQKLGRVQSVQRRWHNFSASRRHRWVRRGTPFSRSHSVTRHAGARLISPFRCSTSS